MFVAAQRGGKRIGGPRMAVVIEAYPGVPMMEGPRRADEANLVMVSNKRMSRATSQEWQGISKAFRLWTGTMTGYAEPEKKLGQAIEYLDERMGRRIVFPVPPEYQNEKNAILVAEHPVYTLESEGTNIVVNAKNVGIVLAFPAKDGHYAVDPEHGIPCGNELVHCSYIPRHIQMERKYEWFLADVRNGTHTYVGQVGTRYLQRTDKRVGSIFRTEGQEDHDCEWLDIHLDCPPSWPAGIVAEAP